MPCDCHRLETMCGHCRTALHSQGITPDDRYLGGSLDRRTARQIARDEAIEAGALDETPKPTEEEEP